MNEYLSKKIQILSFVLMIAIVVLHSQMLSISTGFGRLFQMFMTQEITRIAVPLFFLISGYLFFVNYHKPAKVFFARKIKRRLRSVLIPYLIVSMGGLLFLYIMQSIPYTQFFLPRN
jgi:surface polysaccharide O-acyltransferase-like enzyme